VVHPASAGRQRGRRAWIAAHDHKRRPSRESGRQIMTQNNLPKLLSDLDAGELIGHVHVTRKRWLKHTAIKGVCWSLAAATGWLVTAALPDILTPLPVPMRVAL